MNNDSNTFLTKVSEIDEQGTIEKQLSGMDEIDNLSEIVENDKYQI